MSAEYKEALRAYDRGDIAAALEGMELCASRGEPLACFVLAVWYRTSDGIERDELKSKYWFARLEELAESGNAEAQWELGQNLRFGNFVPQDISRANYWLEGAAVAGHGEAQHHLAWFYEFGQYGYPLDADLAEEWYVKALKSGNAETEYLFALRMFDGGLPSAECVQLMREAASKKFAPALDFLTRHQH